MEIAKSTAANLLNILNLPLFASIMLALEPYGCWSEPKMNGLAVFLAVSPGRGKIKWQLATDAS
jgi:hypothetical protein